MAQFGGTFDASAVEPNTPFDPLPPGKYKAQIIASEFRATRSGSGQYLWLEMEVIEGEHAQRRLYDQLNLHNPNAQAVEIAQRTLSAICRAVGQLAVSDSEQLHFRPLIVSVRTVPREDTGELQNRIKGYEPAGAAAAPVAATAPAAAAPTAAKPATATPTAAASAQPAAPAAPTFAPAPGQAPPWQRVG